MVHDGSSAIRRQVMEIAAVVPTLRDDFTIEPLFVRERLGAPLRWTGALPSRLVERLGRVTQGAAYSELVSAAGMAS